MPGGLAIRTATRAEVDIAVEWAAAEGWNPGLHDADCFHAADPGGFLIGHVDGEPVATISVVKYAGGHAFLGFYIVKPGYRGQGHGLAIWKAGMERLAGCNVGLDGVVAQQDNYRKSGFRLAWGNIRQEGIAGGAAEVDPQVVPVAALEFDRVALYDAKHFGTDRTVFLRCWLRQPGSAALAFVDGGRIEGYGMVRPCRTGWKVGPLFADKPAVARALFAALRSRIPRNDAVFLDTPATNPHAIALAAEAGMHPVFETARMYTGPVPPLDVEQVYGVTSFELG